MASVRKYTPYGAATYGNVAYDLAGTADRPLHQGGAEVLTPKRRARSGARALTRPKVRVREAGYVAPFAVIGFLAVAVFAVLLMFSYAKLTAVNDQVVSARNQLNSLKTEESKLLTQYELAFDLNSIEKQALAGGMVKPQIGQTYVLDLSKPDSVVRYQQQEGSSKADSLKAEVISIWNNLVEYFR